MRQRGQCPDLQQVGAGSSGGTWGQPVITLHVFSFLRSLLAGFLEAVTVDVGWEVEGFPKPLEREVEKGSMSWTEGESFRSARSPGKQ